MPLSETVVTELTNIIQNSSFRCGFATIIADSQGKMCYTLGDKRLFPAASTIKIAIALELYKRFEQSTLHPQQTIQVYDIVPGGILEELSDNRQFNLRELARLMLILSDNTATNMLIDLLGFDSINARLQSLELHDIVLRRYMMEDAAIRGENTASAVQMATLLLHLDSGKILVNPWREELLEIMHRQMFREKIPARLPEDVWCANKVGELDGVRADAAIVRCNSATLYMAAYTSGVKENWLADDTIARLANLCYTDIFNSTKNAAQRSSLN